MQGVTLFHDNDHEFILLNVGDAAAEDGVPSNQYLIRHGAACVLLDPGGFSVMRAVLACLAAHADPDDIRAIFLSHQDPDILGGLPAWLEATDARVYLPSVWRRFLPHCGVHCMDRVSGVSDEGGHIEIADGFQLQVIPAHFLHSPGHINVYDPISQILFTGDVGASLVDGHSTSFIDDFATHESRVVGFHTRYMAGNRALRHWLRKLEALDVRMVAPQHGPVYRGSAVKGLFDWLRDLRCGIDLLPEPSSAS